MSIQKTALPAPVEDLFAFHKYPFTEDGAAVAKAIFGRGLWPVLVNHGEAPWPAIEGARVLVGRVADGAIFVLETEENLLAVGAVGRVAGSPVWDGLMTTVADMRTNMFDVLRSSGVNTEEVYLPAEPTPPTQGPWLVVVPMIGLRYYLPDKEAILTSLNEFGHYLISAGMSIPVGSLAN